MHPTIYLPPHRGSEIKATRGNVHYELRAAIRNGHTLLVVHIVLGAPWVSCLRPMSQNFAQLWNGTESIGGLGMRCNDSRCEPSFHSHIMLAPMGNTSVGSSVAI